mmetsp:Transcript_21485/g.46916  ORF Transcript_21485/g.46916 Transcript_21485/m.46916 type:complete len:207 (+) Transcript_21485:817-1437(+)
MPWYVSENASYSVTKRECSSAAELASPSDVPIASIPRKIASASASSTLPCLRSRITSFLRSLPLLAASARTYSNCSDDDRCPSSFPSSRSLLRSEPTAFLECLEKECLEKECFEELFEGELLPNLLLNAGELLNSSVPSPSPSPPPWPPSPAKVPCVPVSEISEMRSAWSAFGCSASQQLCTSSKTRIRKPTVAASLGRGRSRARS